MIFFYILTWKHSALFISISRRNLWPSKIIYQRFGKAIRRRKNTPHSCSVCRGKIQSRRFGPKYFCSIQWRCGRAGVLKLPEHCGMDWIWLWQFDPNQENGNGNTDSKCGIVQIRKATSICISRWNRISRISSEWDFVLWRRQVLSIALWFWRVFFDAGK